MLLVLGWSIFIYWLGYDTGRMNQEEKDLDRRYDVAWREVKRRLGPYTIKRGRK